MLLGTGALALAVGTAAAYTRRAGKTRLTSDGGAAADDADRAPLVGGGREAELNTDVVERHEAESAGEHDTGEQQ